MDNLLGGSWHARGLTPRESGKAGLRPCSYPCRTWQTKSSMHVTGVLELRLVANGLVLGMRCTSVSLRNKWTALVGKLLRRISSSIHFILHKWSTGLGSAGSLGTAEQAERDRDIDCKPLAMHPMPFVVQGEGPFQHGKVTVSDLPHQELSAWQQCRAMLPLHLHSAGQGPKNQAGHHIDIPCTRIHIASIEHMCDPFMLMIVCSR